VTTTQTSWGIERAIQQGIDSARAHKKDSAPEPYNLRHPLFMYWLTALVTAQDCRDWSAHQVRDKVLGQVKWRGVG
jgi:hypothetical protein